MPLSLILSTDILLSYFLPDKHPSGLSLIIEVLGKKPRSECIIKISHVNMWLDLHTGREVRLFYLKKIITDMCQIKLCLQALSIITLTYLDSSKLNHYYSSCT